MDDELFPSGPWTGFYNYTGPEDRRRMDLHLAFDNGRMTGDGSDDIGAFLIAGRYNATSRDCDWVKTYPGSHNVFYRGFRDGAGIWGTWEIPPFSKGGFHIWPRQSGNGEHATRAAQVELPVEAIATEDAASQGNKATDLGARLRRSGMFIEIRQPDRQLRRSGMFIEIHQPNEPSSGGAA